MTFLSDSILYIKQKIGLTEKSVPANDRNKHRVADQKLRRDAKQAAGIPTPLGIMTPAQYADYVKSLTPESFRHNYRALHCGHKFAKAVKPRTNCPLCWTMFYTENPAILVGMKSFIDSGREAELVHRFGKKMVKKAKSFIAANTQLWAEPEAA